VASFYVSHIECLGPNAKDLVITDETSNLVWNETVVTFSYVFSLCISWILYVFMSLVLYNYNLIELRNFSIMLKGLHSSVIQ
jgi:hypothetical protein